MACKQCVTLAVGVASQRDHLRQNARLLQRALDRDSPRTAELRETVTKTRAELNENIRELARHKETCEHALATSTV